MRNGGLIHTSKMIFKIRFKHHFDIARKNELHKHLLTEIELHNEEIDKMDDDMNYEDFGDYEVMNNKKRGNRKKEGQDYEMLMSGMVR